MITEYKDSELDLVLEATERMHEHLTAAVVSNDILFTQASAVNDAVWTCWGAGALEASVAVCSSQTI